jgi:hypothetical protein
MLLSLPLSLMVACGSDSNGGGDTVADTAQNDTTPTGDIAPDTAVGVDGVVTDFCRDDSECDGTGEVCDCQGLCVVPSGRACTEDRNCGVPNWCNPCTNHCEPQKNLCESCTLGRGCKDLGECLPYASGGNFCGLACVTSAGCPTGYSCLAVAGAGSQCVANSGTCVDLGLCATDAECPLGEVCNAQSRVCGPGCTEDGQCQQGTVCVQARCVPPCGGDGDCVSPATCQAGKCKIPGACEAAVDCPTPETYCDRVSGQCVGGCQVDADCRNAAKICQANACVDKGCQHNYECAFGQVCNKGNGQCVPYPASEPYCAVCDPQAENDPACPSPNICVSFQDENQQPLGDHCLVPCKNDPIDRCPSGWQCQRLEDPETGAEQFFCARPCYLTPVTTP